MRLIYTALILLLVLSIFAQSQPDTDSKTVESSIIMLFNASESMEDNNKIDSAKTAVREFVSGLDPTIDELALIVFYDCEDIVVEQPFTSDQSAIASKIDAIRPTGKTPLSAAMAFAKIPMLLPGEMAQTHLDPMASMMGLLSEIEAAPGVLDASLIKTHCWADVPDQGISAVVVTDGDQALAQRQANRLASAFWEQRHRFRVSAETYEVDEAIEVALRAPERTVFLSDAGDNATAGGTTEIPDVLRQLLARGVDNAVPAAICDPEAVEACVQAGIGGRVKVSLGGRIDPQYAPPLRVSGIVRLLSGGRTYRGGVRTPAHQIERGPIAVLSAKGIDVVLSQKRISFVEPAELRSLGIEPLAYRIVILKVGYLHAPFQAISPRSILMLSPGPTNCDVTRLPYRRVRRPIYPLDPDATWVAN